MDEVDTKKLICEGPLITEYLPSMGDELRANAEFSSIRAEIERLNQEGAKE